MDQKSDKTKKTLLILLGVVAVISLLAIGLKSHLNRSQVSTSNTVKTLVVSPANLTYKGENGKDALTLLKQHAHIQLDASGMVDEINGYKANNGRREYWEFLVNGKQAQVGPASFVTKSTDTIAWRIATY